MMSNSPPGHFLMACLAKLLANFSQTGSWPAAPSQANAGPLPADWSTTNATLAHGIFRPEQLHLPEPWGRPWPGTAQHVGLSKHILLRRSSKSAGQVLMCLLSREGDRGQAHLLPRRNRVFSPFHFKCTNLFIYCLFTAQKDPQHFPIKAHVQLFDERQRTENKQQRRRGEQNELPPGHLMKESYAFGTELSCGPPRSLSKDGCRWVVTGEA